jgi:hypothetical protein
LPNQDFGWHALPDGLDVRRMPNPTTSEYTRGVLYGSAAVCIWAGFIVVSRLGVRATLTPWDVAAITFAVAGSLQCRFHFRVGIQFPLMRPGKVPRFATIRR